MPFLSKPHIRSFLLIALIILLTQPLPLSGCQRQSRTPQTETPTGPPPYDTVAQEAWVDSTLSALSTKERIMQSVMVSAYSNSSQEPESIKRFIDQGIGGLIFFQGSTAEQARLTSLYQQQAQLPLLIAIDAEWGAAMRLNDAPVYPRAMGLAATGLPQITYQAANALAKELRNLGVHLNCAPVADINTHPENPIIGLRAFGDDPEMVATHAAAFCLGQREANIISCAKHFPGHGNVATDSHKTLPYNDSDLAYLEQNDLYPFRALIDQGVECIMVGHICFPALGCKPNEPASLAPIIVDSLLRKSMGFNGIICTDALNMTGALAGGITPDSAAYKAYIAGADLLVCVSNPKATLSLILDALERGDLTLEQIDSKCKRLLRAKYRFIIYPQRQTTPNSANAADTTAKPQNGKVQQQEDPALYYRTESNPPIIDQAQQASITLLKKTNIPLGSMNNETIGYINLMGKQQDHFADFLAQEVDYRTLTPPTSATANPESLAQQTTLGTSLIIITARAMGYNPTNAFGLTKQRIRFIQACAAIKPTILVLFGSPYAINSFSPNALPHDLMIAYDDSPAAQKAAVLAIIGRNPILGQLPVSLNDTLKRGTGIQITSPVRLSYSPVGIGILRPEYLALADSIANAAIAACATPGMQILAAKDGHVFYRKCFGSNGYEPTAQAVTPQTLYDIASLTKIVATTPLIMHYHGNGTLTLNDRIEKHLPELEDTPLAQLTIGDLLLHRAGLKAWYPFYINTLENLWPDKPLKQKGISEEYPYHMGANQYLAKHAVPSKEYYASRPTQGFSIRIAPSMYGADRIADSILLRIRTSPLGKAGRYTYSDWGFILLGKVAERLAQAEGDTTSIGPLAQMILYNPLGLKNTLYDPWRLDLELRCAPSENDILFRKGVVQGYVHDLGAALLGGQAGHAGLFSNMDDLAEFAQMILQNGTYGGSTILDSATVSTFTQLPEKVTGNTRCYGFDRKAQRKNGALIGNLLPPDSYGHVGFTGTILWIDPTTQFLFVLLANRTFPDPLNTTFNALAVRRKIMDALYAAVTDNIGDPDLITL